MSVHLDFVKQDVTLEEVNKFMHSFAALLYKNNANTFYDSLQVTRVRAKNPEQLLEVVLQEVQKYTAE